jgi:hypothetical protein
MILILFGIPFLIVFLYLLFFPVKKFWTLRRWFVAFSWVPAAVGIGSFLWKELAGATEGYGMVVGLLISLGLSFFSAIMSIRLLRYAKQQQAQRMMLGVATVIVSLPLVLALLALFVSVIRR